MSENVLPENAVHPGSRRVSNPVYLGVGTNGDLEWDAQEFPNVMSTGVPGSGKTLFLQNMVDQCLASDWEVHVLTRDENAASEWPNDPRFIMSDRLITSLEDLMKINEKRIERYTHMIAEGVNSYLELVDPPKPILVVIDEIESIISHRLESLDPDTYAKYVMLTRSIIANLARLGRASGIHVIFSSLNEKYIPDEMEWIIDSGVRVSIGGRQKVHHIHESAPEVTKLQGRAWVTLGKDGQEIQLYGPVPK